MGYVFFDTETTGLAEGFDQIVQFAAIYTDNELNELERINVRSRLQPHVVPHPQALRANGLTISTLTDRNLPSHYEMICQVRHQLLSWSPAIFAGFNSIRFDENMLRHALFQSLYPAYLTSNHQNGRGDAFGLVQSACALSPGCLVVPRNPNGRPSFKLDQLAPANGINYAGAHDAMVDATTTVELCRLVKERSPEAWQRFIRLSNRAAVAELVDEEDAFLLTEFFGGEPYHRPVTCIGLDRFPNGRFCLDVSIIPETWRDLSDEELHAALARKGSPIRRLRTNSAPTLTRFYEAEAHLLEGFDPAEAEERGRRLKADPDLCARLIATYTASWKDAEPSPYPERRLVSGGFPENPDENRCISFHEVGWQERIEIVGRLDDPRLKAFGQRLIYNEHRSILLKKDQVAADLELAGRLLIDRDGPLTLGKALKETEALLVDDIGDPIGNLTTYRDYLLARIAAIEAFQREHEHFSAHTAN